MHGQEREKVRNAYMSPILGGASANLISTKFAGVGILQDVITNANFQSKQFILVTVVRGLSYPF